MSEANTSQQQGSRERAVAALLEMLRTSLTAARSVPLATYEELSGDGLLPLLGIVREIIQGAIGVLDLAVRRYDANERASRESLTGNLRRELDRRMDDPASREKVAGLAFVAQFALRAHLSTLATIGTKRESWEVIARCGAALSEVHKSLAALEVSICEVEHLPITENSYFSELDRSLQIRRAYAAFRRELAVHDTPTPPTLYVRIRRVGTSIAKLIGREIYPSARVHDRWMIRKLQRRVCDWVTQNTSFANAGKHDVYATSGLRLWEEVVNVAELFMQVNNRAELRERDLVLLDSAIANVTTAGCSPEEFARLTPLWGRDPAIDFYIDNPDRFDCAGWMEALQRARAKLGATSVSATPGPTGFVPRRSVPNVAFDGDPPNPDDTF